MAEYIDRGQLIANLKRFAPGGYSEKTALIIGNQPAADVAPVRHGKWMLRRVRNGHFWVCSACHINPCIYVTQDTKYCPNCGAKMDGEVSG